MGIKKGFLVIDSKQRKIGKKRKSLWALKPGQMVGGHCISFIIANNKEGNKQAKGYMKGRGRRRGEKEP